MHFGESPTHLMQNIISGIVPLFKDHQGFVDI